MNERDDLHQELALLALGELDTAREAEIRSILAADPELDAVAGGLAAALAALHTEATVEVRDDFNVRLRRQFAADSQTQSLADSKIQSLATSGGALPVATAPPRKPRFRFLTPLSLAAAAAVLAISIFGPFWPGGHGLQSALAWSEVVEAVNQVRFFHATVYQESGQKTERLDFYYRRPNTWRIQGAGRVIFSTPSGAGFYDVESRAWLLRCERFDATVCQNGNCPPAVTAQLQSFAASMERGNMLDGVLSAIPSFRGKPPVGEPIKADQEIAGQGLEVFDYAIDADASVRIWVLKESRLPIRIALSQPGGDQSMLVVFDYTAAPPESCFDLGKFEKGLATKPHAPAAEIYNQGLRRSAGLHSPVLVGIESADTGDLLITTEDPHNRTAEGAYISGGYRPQLFDNWENTYYRISPEPGRYQKVLEQVYQVVPPLKRGAGTHTITLRYCVWGNDDGSPINYDKIVGEQAVAIPPPRGAGVPDRWPQTEVLRDSDRRAHALYEFHRGRSPLAVQLDSVDPLLRKSPDDLELLYEKLEILGRYGLDDDRFLNFERQLKERALAEPFRDDRLDQLLGDYLIHLHNSGRRDEFRALLERLNPLKDRLLASDQPALRQRAAAFRRFTTSLPVALAIPDARAAVEKTVGENAGSPQVSEIFRAFDGTLHLSIARPENRDRNPSDHTWSAPRVAPGSGWTISSSVATGDRVLIEVQGDGKSLELVFDVMIVPLVTPRDVPSYRLDRMSWSLKVDLPDAKAATPEESAARRAAWYAADGLGNLVAPSPARQIWANADRLFETGKYHEASAAYRGMLSWPRREEAAATADAKSLTDGERRTLEAREISCLVRLDRFTEAEAAADRLQKASPPPDLASPDGIHDGGEARGARVELANRLIDLRRFDEARRILDQLEQNRPDTRLLDDRYIATKVPYGVRVWQPTNDIWRTWKRADVAEWRLRQALADRPTPE